MELQDSPQNTQRFHIDLGTIWYILWSQRQTAALFFIAAVSTTFVATLLSPPRYKATSRLELDPVRGTEVGMQDVVDVNNKAYHSVLMYYRTQVKVITSRTVREMTLKQFLENCSAHNATGESKWDCAPFEPNEDGKLPVGLLQDITRVIPSDQSRLMDITVTWSDPEVAAELANLTADSYIQYNLNTLREVSAGAKEWVEDQLVKHQVALSTAQSNAQAYKQDHGLADVEEQSTTLKARLISLNEAHAEASTNRVLLQTKVQTLTELQNEGKWEDLARVLESTLLGQLQARLSDTIAEQAQLSSKYGPKHPKMLQSEQRRMALEDAIRTEVTRLLAGNKAELRLAQMEEQRLNSELEVAKADLLTFQASEAEFSKFRRARKQAENFQERLHARLDEVTLAAQTQLNNVRVLDAALVPTSPAGPNMLLNLALAIMAGLVGGVGLAFGRNYMADQLNSPEEVSLHLGTNLLGFVPQVPGELPAEQGDLYTYMNPRSATAEAVRMLRLHMSRMPDGSFPRTILITSSTAQEGKTSTSIRLAVAFAQLGKKVVLVDSDLRRPRIRTTFRSHAKASLPDYLEGLSAVDDILNDTPVDGLTVVNSERAPDFPAELMASTRMTQLIEDLKERFDLVIFDTPPAVMLADPLSLATQVDMVALVVRQGHVTRSMAQRTLNKMRSVNAPLKGVILNSVDTAGSGHQYYYKQYYHKYLPAEDTQTTA